MHQTFDVTVNGKLIYRTDWTLGGTQKEAHERALDVAMHHAKHNPKDVPTVKLVNHV